ncbi:TetR/AcrR family transcriptional regulator [Propioniciclava sp.]|uniref:TetR/AcrR family transcriptional regulator n=1 Tax=Propioniciclava sp. TaxID=2038686 RepID=UPI0026153879|nr:TetR/AcrR family transcriptional regulator [Propioniciclava sp.]
MTTTDGRATRWAEHNLARRTELVEATLRAIRKHGHTVGMEEIAASAGTSKTVFYRHFGDRNGLYAAVVESVHTFIRGNLDRPLSAALPPADLVTELADAYLAVVEGDVEIYRFVTNRPAGSPDPVLGITNRIGDEVAAAFGAWLTDHGLDPAPASTWGHGVTGFVWAVADRWILTDLRRPRADIVAFVAQLFAPAFAHQNRTDEGVNA